MPNKEPQRIRVDVHHHYPNQEQQTEFRTRKEEEEGPRIGYENSFDPPPRPRIVKEK